MEKYCSFVCFGNEIYRASEEMKPSDCAKCSPYPDKSSGHLFMLHAPAKSPSSLGEWHPLDTICHSLSALLQGALFYYTELLELCWKSQVLSVAYAWIYLQWLLSLTVPLCEWTWSVCWVLCAYRHLWVLWVSVHSGCLCRHVQAHTHTEERLDSETVFLLFYPATRHAFSHYNASSEVFLFYFSGARGKFLLQL